MSSHDEVLRISSRFIQDVKTFLMRILLYGHSQTYGMGADLQAALRAQGHDVTRIWHSGWRDPELLQAVYSLPSGPWDRVYLYLGGNTTTPTTEALLGIVQHFGIDRSTVILPPVNADYTSYAPTRRRVNSAHADALQALNVRTYQLETTGNFFQPDQVHLLAGSQPSIDLANRIAYESLAPTALTRPSPDNSAVIGWSVGVGLAALGLVGLAIVLARRRR